VVAARLTAGRESLRGAETDSTLGTPTASSAPAIADTARTVRFDGRKAGGFAGAAVLPGAAGA